MKLFGLAWRVVAAVVPRVVRARRAVWAHLADADAYGPGDALLMLGASRSRSRAQLGYLNADGSLKPRIDLGSAPTSLADDAVPLPSIDEVVRDLATKQARLSQYIESCLEKGVEVPELTRLFALHGQNASRLGHLLRDRMALSGEAGDMVSEAIALALDELEHDLEAKP